MRWTVVLRYAPVSTVAGVAGEVPFGTTCSVRERLLQQVAETCGAWARVDCTSDACGAGMWGVHANVMAVNPDRGCRVGVVGVLRLGVRAARIAPVGTCTCVTYVRVLFLVHVSGGPLREAFMATPPCIVSRSALQ